MSILWESSKKATASDSNVFTPQGFRPLVVRYIIMEEAQTTHDPAQDRSYLRLGHVVNKVTFPKDL